MMGSSKAGVKFESALIFLLCRRPVPFGLFNRSQHDVSISQVRVGLNSLQGCHFIFWVSLRRRKSAVFLQSNVGVRHASIGARVMYIFRDRLLIMLNALSKS